MVNKEKYLYWFDTENQNLNDEIVRREMYSRIGFIFHIVQMIEYNIANIIAIEENTNAINEFASLEDIKIIKGNIKKKTDYLFSLTFGNLKKEIKKTKCLSIINVEELNDIKIYRDYLAHKCFKEKLIDNKLAKIEDIDLFVDELNDYECKIKRFNDKLIDIFGNIKTKNLLIIV